MPDAAPIAAVPAPSAGGTAGAPAVTSAQSAPGAAPVPPAGEAKPDAGSAPVAPAPPQESAVTKHLRKREADLIARQNEFAARERNFAASSQATIDAAVAKAIAARDAAIKGDPVAQLQAMGFTEQEIAQRLLNKGKPAPEEVAQRALAEAQKIRDELGQRQVQEARAASEKTFLDEIGSDAYEHISLEWPNKSDALHEARAELQRFAAQGKDPNTVTYKQLAKYLDRLAKYRSEQRDERKAERAKKASSQEGTKADGKGGPGSGSSAKGQPATTTLGAGLPGSETVSGVGKKGRPPTDAEIIAHVMEQDRLGLLNGKAAH